MNNTVQGFSNSSRNPNENIIVEVMMTAVFVTIIVFSALVLLSV
jgi:hypothetical protein